MFLILIGALRVRAVLALSGLPEKIAQWPLASSRRASHPVCLILIYIVLGMFLEGFSMLVLTLAIVIPIVEALRFDLIWFGVIMVIVLEMGLISPPVGINVFVVKGLLPRRSDRPDFQGHHAILAGDERLHRCSLIAVSRDRDDRVRIR